MPVKMIREQISTSLDVIVHISRLRDGSRKVLNIAEVQSTDGDTLKLQSIFHYKDALVHSIFTWIRHVNLLLRDSDSRVERVSGAR